LGCSPNVGVTGWVKGKYELRDYEGTYTGIDFRQHWREKKFKKEKKRNMEYGKRIVGCFSCNQTTFFRFYDQILFDGRST